MNTLNFRAWDLKNKKMIYNIKPIKPINIETFNREMDQYFSNYSDCVIMQGVRVIDDKTKKEYFEGDIVKIDDQKFIIKFNEKDQQFNLYSLKDQSMSYFDNINGEIIGNIYENKY